MWSHWLVVCDCGFSLSALWSPLSVPTVLLGFLLPWTWGSLFRAAPAKRSSAPYLRWGVAPLGCRPCPWVQRRSSQLRWCAVPATTLLCSALYFTNTIYFANKGPSSQGYGFSSGHVWMWELDYKESWAWKNWCFWTVVLEKTLENLLDCKKIQPVHSRGDQSWVSIGRTDAETESPILWPPDAKSWLIWKVPDAGKDWGQEEKGMTEDEMVGWHYWLNGHGFGWTLEVGDGQGGLPCCCS